MTFDDRRRAIRRRRALIAAIVTVAVLGIFLVLILPMLAGSGTPAEPSEPGATPRPTPSAVFSDGASSDDAMVDTATAPAPGMVSSLAPPDGTHPDVPPFGVDAYAMRDELRTHGVDLSDDRLYQLVAMADKYIAQDDPDLDAWDPRIKRDVKAMWPNATKAEVIDVTRCVAEYVERVIARNHGWPHPPDEDDHNVTVDGRGPVPH